jgi:hypothetical protein
MTLQQIEKHFLAEVQSAFAITCLPVGLQLILIVLLSVSVI